MHPVRITYLVLLTTEHLFLVTERHNYCAFSLMTPAFKSNYLMQTDNSICIYLETKLNSCIKT